MLTLVASITSLIPTVTAATEEWTPTSFVLPSLCSSERTPCTSTRSSSLSEQNSIYLAGKGCNAM
jgi:hypothetical protein